MNDDVSPPGSPPGAVPPGAVPPGPVSPGSSLPAPAPRRSAGDRLLIASAIVALVLLAGGIAWFAAGRLGVLPGTAASPTPVPTPVVTPALPPTSTPRPTPAGSASPGASSKPGATLLPGQIEEQVAEIATQVARLRGLSTKQDVPNRVLDEAAVREEFARSFDEENPPDELKAGQDLLERMGFVEPGLDLRALYLDALGSQVLGYYRDDEKDMTIVQRDDAFGPLERMTLSHEYTHALQDQHFDLASLETDDVTQGDRSMARLALVEGDASLLMTQWAQRNLDARELTELVQESSDPAQQAALDRLPPILRQQLTFPYEDGLAFALQVYMRGGWDAIDAAYQKLPDSTEQILHPGKYTAGEKPVAVDVAGLAAKLGAGWKESATDTVGEFATRVWLEAAKARPSPDSVPADEAAAGWGGDRVVSLDGPDGAWALAWKTAWDSPGDAYEFETAAAPLVEGMDHASMFSGPLPNGKLILVASDDATLRKLIAAAGIAY